MSDLTEWREHLRLSLDATLAAASIAELDAEHLLEAVTDALDIFDAAEMVGGSDAERMEARAEAARGMADRLNALRRVHVSTVQL